MGSIHKFIENPLKSIEIPINSWLKPTFHDLKPHLSWFYPAHGSDDREDA